MGQIMRLRRIATADHHIVDRNNGERHEEAFATLIRDNGLLWEAELLPRSYGGNSFFGKFHPRAAKELLGSLPAIVKALVRRKVTPAGALKPHRIPKPDLRSVQTIYEKVEGRDRRYELNLYIAGADEEPTTEVLVAAGVVVDVVADAPEGAHSAPGPEGATKPPPPEADAGESSEAAAPTGTDIEAE